MCALPCMPGCTLVVLDDLQHQAAPCAAVGDCDAGAVTSDVHVVVTVASATHVAAGLTLRSAFYDVAPKADLVGQAVIDVPVVGACAGCRVYQEQRDGTFQALQDIGPVDDVASGILVDVAGIYAAAIE